LLRRETDKNIRSIRSISRQADGMTGVRRNPADPSPPLISVVVPCYNEEHTLNVLHRALSDAFSARSDIRYETIFVDDGSADGTPATLEKLASQDHHIVVVTLSRNFGHQAAIAAGLSSARGQAVIVCDADLQDTPAAMMMMIDRWLEGADVVYGVRNRKKISLIKRVAYFTFYRLLRLLADLEIPLDSGDFGLMDRKVVDAINSLPERNRFVRGLRAWVGYSQAPLAYDRPARQLGESKYSIPRLLHLALDGIFDFSTKPLLLIFYLGVASSLLSLAGFVFYLVYRIAGLTMFGRSPADVPGFTSLIMAIFFFGGVQLLAIGVLGEYIGRIYKEVKQRPNFIVKSARGPEKESSPSVICPAGPEERHVTRQSPRGFVQSLPGRMEKRSHSGE
jgi:dolichol-phosphate mannosyltransferase